MTRRIDKSEVQGIRNRLKAKQGNVCAICKKAFTKADYPVLDHDHDTGFIRGVLHNSCNQAEGKVKSRAHMSHKGVSSAEYVIALGEYLKLHSTPQTKVYHHEHLTDDEKRLARNAKARRKRASAKRKKEKEDLKKSLK